MPPYRRQHGGDPATLGTPHMAQVIAFELIPAFEALLLRAPLAA